MSSNYRQQRRPDFSDASDARRRNMAAIAGKHTQPEMLVRRAIHKMGYRYRLHVGALPGRPDIVLSRRRKIIEVRGCFWHRHPNFEFAATPRTRAEFWMNKFQQTVDRDVRNLATLQGLGWAVLIVWECEAGDRNLESRLKTFLDG